MSGRVFSPFSCLVYCSIFCLVFFCPASCQTSLSSQDQQELLNAHNYFRGIVDPTASNMETMVWNAELATVAQNYAAQCVFEHNSQRVSQQSTFTSVGENLYASSGLAVNYTSAVQSWFNERSDYTYETNTCAENSVCGHYTQVVWATSNSLGCGVYLCAQLGGFTAPNALNLVCNYGPAGNFVGQQPYSSGTPCSSCRDGLDFCVENLCSSMSSSVTASEFTTNMNVFGTATTPESGDAGTSTTVAQVSAEVTTVAGNGGDNTTSAGGTSGAITHYGK